MYRTLGGEVKETYWGTVGTAGTAGAAGAAGSRDMSGPKDLQGVCCRITTSPIAPGPLPE
jgi:hypothetical protein